MIVQWCVKGLGLDNDDQAKDIIDGRHVIECNWWRTVLQITAAEWQDRLTLPNLDRRVNHFTSTDPSCGQPFNTMTPFISLSAGTVERDAAAQTNLVHRARRTALWFGLEFGRRPFAYPYICWLVLAPRQAVQVWGVAEEVRDFNTYRRYSSFQTEGEVTAKVIVPANQILGYEKWSWDRSAHSLTIVDTYWNDQFTPAEQLSNVRSLI